MQVGDLGRVVVDDIGVVGVAGGVVLVVGLGWIEGLQGRHLGDDGAGNALAAVS